MSDRITYDDCDSDDYQGAGCGAYDPDTCCRDERARLLEELFLPALRYRIETNANDPWKFPAFMKSIWNDVTKEYRNITMRWISEELAGEGLFEDERQAWSEFLVWAEGEEKKSERPPQLFRKGLPGPLSPGRDVSAVSLVSSARSSGGTKQRRRTPVEPVKPKPGMLDEAYEALDSINEGFLDSAIVDRKVEKYTSGVLKRTITITIELWEKWDEERIKRESELMAEDRKKRERLF